ncbi:MAG: cation transporter [Candidatus Eisenbacteria bacterium]|nr:cation transporter [Candidatus Eisenbacteria bacterium]
MTCESCAREIEEGLRKVPSVVTAAVEYPSGCAEVGLDRSGADPAPLLSAVRNAGYRARVAR